MNENSASENTTAFIFANSMYPWLLRAAGTNGYGFDCTPNDYSYNHTGSIYAGSCQGYSANLSKCFPNSGPYGSCQGIQAGIDPLFDTASSISGWHAATQANLLADRLQKYNYGQTIACVSPGPQYDCAARTNGNGNLLMIQSFKHGTKEITTDLTPYLVSGQGIIRYYGTYQGIQIGTLAAGTTSDTVSCETACFIAYVFANNATAEYPAPVFSANLADIPNATKILLSYAYDLYPFSQQSDVLPFVFDCGGGTCTPPWDRTIGPVYYQLRYLNSSGNVLATSDVQTY